MYSFPGGRGSTEEQQIIIALSSVSQSPDPAPLRPPSSATKDELQDIPAVHSNATQRVCVRRRCGDHEGTSIRALALQDPIFLARIHRIFKLHRPSIHPSIHPSSVFPSERLKKHRGSERVAGASDDGVQLTIGKIGKSSSSFLSRVGAVTCFQNSSGTQRITGEHE